MERRLWESTIFKPIVSNRTGIFLLVLYNIRKVMPYAKIELLSMALKKAPCYYLPCVEIPQLSKFDIHNLKHR